MMQESPIVQLSSREPGALQRRLLCFAVLLVAAGLSGCGGGDEGPELAVVRGTVTLDGKPVQGAIVQFVPLGGEGTTSVAETDADGRYELQYTTNRSGAVVGECLVRIESGDPIIVGGENLGNREVFAPRYNTNSELKVTVESGKNEFNFDCKSESGGSTAASPVSRFGYHEDEE